MSATIEFVFDFGSPNVYLAYRALPPILARTGAGLIVNPCLLGGVFKATGNASPVVKYAPIKGKFEYEMLEVRRFVARHRFERFRLNPHFSRQHADADARIGRRPGSGRRRRLP
jgi:2-hydroxychromene-2-carboxylate isomerase